MLIVLVDRDNAEFTVACLDLTSTDRHQPLPRPSPRGEGVFFTDARQACDSLSRCRPRPGGQGDEFLNLRDAGDPVEVAARYEAEGADELVFLDITASHEGRDIMLDVVRRTAEVVFMPLTVGGGIRTLEDIRALLNAGCDKVSINSAACKNPEFVREAARRFGSQCIVVNIDPKRVTKNGHEMWEVHINGGRVPTGLEAVPGPGRSNGWGPAKLCSPAWMPTAPKWL